MMPKIGFDRMIYLLARVSMHPTHATVLAQHLFLSLLTLRPNTLFASFPPLRLPCLGGSVILSSKLHDHNAPSSRVFCVSFFMSHSHANTTDTLDDADSARYTRSSSRHIVLTSSSSEALRNLLFLA